MKSLKNLNSIFALAMIASLFTFSGCDKDEDDHTDDHQHLFLKFHHHVGADELVLNQDFTSNGVKFQISRINYYLSGLKMQIDHSDVYQNYDDVYLLIDETTDEVELGEIPAGGMHGLEFAIGIEDSATNHSDPATWPSSHPLAPQSPSMHWDWNPGYIFIAIEGMVDTDSDGTVDADMEMHVGLDKNLAHHDSHHHFNVTAGTDVTLNVELDLLQVFSGIDLATQYITHSMGSGDSLAMAISANLPAAFNVE
ncbi:MAG: MbnP family protein [Chitinophagales bacterium]|nr:MbnP family protein [Chitinophagales bacterium]